MLKIFFKKIFIFRVAKTNTKKKRLEKLLFLIPEKIGDRKLSECKTIKYQLNIEKKVYG